jgi:hypothetical protein
MQQANKQASERETNEAFFKGYNDVYVCTFDNIYSIAIGTVIKATRVVEGV